MWLLDVCTVGGASKGAALAAVAASALQMRQPQLAASSVPHLTSPDLPTLLDPNTHCHPALLLSQPAQQQRPPAAESSSEGGTNWAGVAAAGLVVAGLSAAVYFAPEDALKGAGPPPLPSKVRGGGSRKEAAEATAAAGLRVLDPLLAFWLRHCLWELGAQLQPRFRPFFASVGAVPMPPVSSAHLCRLAPPLPPRLQPSPAVEIERPSGPIPFGAAPQAAQPAPAVPKPAPPPPPPAPVAPPAAVQVAPKPAPVAPAPAAPAPEEKKAAEPAKVEAAKVEAAKPEAAKPEPAKAEAAKAEAAKAETATPAAPAAKLEAPAAPAAVVPVPAPKVRWRWG